MQGKSTIPRVNLLRAHGSLTNYLYRRDGCRCLSCRASKSSSKRDYYANNKAAIVEKAIAYKRKIGKEMVAKYDASYTARNPEKTAAFRSSRRARERRAPGHHSAADIRAQYDKQNGLCFWCGRPAESDGRRCHVDHVYPLSRGGSNWPENLAISCSHCNLSKQAKMPHEWRKALPAPQ